MPITLPSWLLPFVGGLLLGGLAVWAWRQTVLEKLKIQLAEFKKEQETIQDKLRWIEQAEANLSEAFDSLAGKALQTNTDEFLKHARGQVENLLNQVRGDWKSHKAELGTMVDPLGKNLETLDQYIRELEQKREGAYQGLHTELEQLGRTHARLQSTADTLTEALKSSTARGRWGELQLRRLIELAGMVPHIDFIEQASTTCGRPDVIIYLPNGGVLPVDAKTPLKFYLEAIEARDEQTRRARLDDHVKTTKERVRELGQKKYWEQFEQAPSLW